MRTSIEINRRNDIVAATLRLLPSNPEKVKEWYEKGQLVRKESNKLFDYIQSLKEK
jgi:hypothetical protein